jgi:hypothetical protein
VKEGAARTAKAPQPLPEEATAFLERVTRGIGSGHRIASEVRQELTNHFEDALDGLDSPDKRAVAVQRLVQDFGDEDLLATLIRRGKRRCDKGAPSTVLGVGIAGGIILLVIAMGGAPGIWVHLPSFLFSVGLIVAPTLTAYGVRALCHALWSIRVLIVNVSPDRISLRDASILRDLSVRLHLAGVIGTLIGLVQLLASIDDPSQLWGGLAVSLLPLFTAFIIAEVILRPAAQRNGFPLDAPST